MNNKVVIFGSNGFVGKALVFFLENKGFNVITVSRSCGNSDLNLDITNKEAFKRIDSQPNIVINCASMLPNGSFWEEESLRAMFEVNFWGSYNIAQWIKNTPSVTQLINLSTLVVHDKPWSINLDELEKVYPFKANQSYPISKLNQELVFQILALENNVKVANLRLSAIFGEDMKWGGIMCSIIDKAINSETLNITNGDLVSFDFLHVNNVCEMIEKVIHNPSNEIINIASGNEIFLKDLAEKTYSYLNVDLNLINNTTTKGINKNRAVVNINKIKNLFDENYSINFLEQLNKLIDYRVKQKNN